MSSASHAGSSQRSRKALVGIDIGGTKTAVVLAAEPPNVVWRREFPTLPVNGPDDALRSIIELTRSGLRETKSQVSAIGVSCGGPLDRIHGVIQRPPNLPSWDDVPIQSILTNQFAVSCYVENDANAGAVAEHSFGAGRGCSHMVFLTLGTGLGAGLILNGKVYHGANGMAGEIGHVRLTETGPVGFGKAGSVEGWASGGGIAQQAEQLVAAAMRAGTETTLGNRASPITALDIGLALAAGDAVAEQIIRETGIRLGEALAILIDLLNPERIIMGGLALRLGEALLAPARARVRQEALEQASQVCQILPAALGERIGDVAALCVGMGMCHS